eukprot:3456753-Pyramimonas_sp.AAC.1
MPWQILQQASRIFNNSIGSNGQATVRAPSNRYQDKGNPRAEQQILRYKNMHLRSAHRATDINV